LLDIAIELVSGDNKTDAEHLDQILHRQSSLLRLQRHLTVLIEISFYVSPSVNRTYTLNCSSLTPVDSSR
jgi:hypothetical protein